MKFQVFRVDNDGFREETDTVEADYYESSGSGWTHFYKRAGGALPVASYREALVSHIQRVE